VKGKKGAKRARVDGACPRTKRSEPSSSPASRIMQANGATTNAREAERDGTTREKRVLDTLRVHPVKQTRFRNHVPAARMAAMSFSSAASSCRARAFNRTKNKTLIRYIREGDASVWRLTIAVKAEENDLGRSFHACRHRFQQSRPVDPMFVLPDGGTEDKVVHIALPRQGVAQVHLLTAYVEGREVITSRCLDFERGRMCPEMRDQVGESCCCSSAELRVV